MSSTTTSTIPSLPTEWKGDDGNSNFHSIGSLSPPVMRKIEPYGAAFLAHARRKRHGRTFSEDDRIQALAKVKKTEDSDDGEISEPEDPELLQRDAKDWKVCVLYPFWPICANVRRRKTTMQSSASRNSATKPQTKTSRRPPERRSFVTTPTRRLLQDKQKATVSSR